MKVIICMIAKQFVSSHRLTDIAISNTGRLAERERMAFDNTEVVIE